MHNQNPLFKNTKIPKIISYLLLLFSIIIICLVIYIYYLQSIPNTIRIKAGTSEELNLKIPASGVISTDSSNIIALNRPVTFVAGNTTDKYEMKLKLFGFVPLKNIDIEVIENTVLTPVGLPIGIYLKTQGVLVIDTGSFTSNTLDKVSPSKNILQSGDYLIAIDGIAITSKRQVIDSIQNSYGKPITFKISRDKNLFQAQITPIADENNVYKLGVWLRDSAQGVGTMTYIDSNNNFGALGHGINDADTGKLLELGSGLLYNTQIVSIKKGKKDTPGELTGVIQYEPNQVAGIIMQNTSKGIYGITDETMSSQYTKNTKQIPIALKHEVTIGPAQIYCCVNNIPKYYDIEITNINKQLDFNKQLSIKITDQELISLTGGIVQGMSGAPIIQNGKFIGAVTHVLVQDPTRGYGVFIEDMITK